MKKTPILLAIAASFLAHAHAFAGAESHGGQVVFCPGQEPVMLDYYQATLPTEEGGTPALIDISKMSAQDVLGLFKSRLSKSDLWDRYHRALDILGPVNTWLEGNLQSVSDSDPAYTLPRDCHLHQLAVRQDSTMYVDPKILNQISPAQQGILMAHEALYYVAQNNGFDSSVEVRMVIRNLLLKNEDIVALSKSVHEMGSDFFWWESITNLSYWGFNSNVDTLQLSYDPLLGGEKLNYDLTYYVALNNRKVHITGQFSCDSDYTHCHTVSRGLNCTLTRLSDSRYTESLSISCPALEIQSEVGSP